MKIKALNLKTIIIMLCVLSGCQSIAQDNILAEKEGYQLTKKHIDKAIVYLETEEGQFSKAEKKAYTQKCILQFLEKPKEVLEFLENLKSNLDSETELNTDLDQAPELKQYPESKQLKIEPKNQTNINLAEGHTYVRKILGKDIGEMKFDTQRANNFRTFMTNTLLSTSSNNRNTSPGGKGFIESSDRIKFCADGTYLQSTYSGIFIDVPGAGGKSHGTTNVPGYWEVAALPNGMFIILMYSTHPNVLNDFPNGLMPWIVPKHGIDFVSLPNGELYKRTPNNYCN